MRAPGAPGSELFAAVAVAVVLCVALSSAAFQGATRSSSATGGCENPVPTAPANTTTAFVLVAPSTAVVCITFAVPGAFSFSPPDYGPSAEGEYTDCGFGLQLLAPSVQQTCSQIAISALPPSTNLTAEANVTVQYHIAASSGLQPGLYLLLPAGCLPAVLFYVGRTPSYAGPGEGEPLSCIYIEGVPRADQVVGVSGLQIVQLPINYT